MSFLTTLAQSSRYYDSYYTATDASSAGAALVLGVGFFLFALLIFAAIYVLFALCLMRIFKKAGVPGWIAWVPVYNSWKLLEIGGQQGFWAVLAFLPIVSIVSAVYMYIAQYHIAKKLGKGGEFVLWAIFIPAVWYIWLAFDSSKWNDAASTAPSLHKPTA